MSEFNSDYVIVGGGVAGLVVAARLTEDPNTTVTVIEAGGDLTNTPEHLIPGLAFGNLGKPELHWLYHTVPQENAHGRKIYQPRGKLLGGCGMINALVVCRGHQLEYDALEELGAEGWNWPSMLESLKKSETFTVTPEEKASLKIDVDPRYHGTSGPFYRSPPKWIGNLHQTFFDAMGTFDVPYNPDAFDGENAGVWVSMNAVEPSRVVRSSAALGYYEPNKTRPNLRVILHALTTRVFFKDSPGPEGLVAEGIEYTKDGTVHVVKAKKEVILSAGSYHSPMLLELSGIGNQDILKAHGIATRINLPGVGEHLQDHPWCSYTVEVNDECETWEMLQNPEFFAAEMEQYQKEKKGVLSQCAPSAYAFLPPSKFMTPEKIRELSDKAAATFDSADRTRQIQLRWFANSLVPHLEVGPTPGFIPGTGKTAESGKKFMSFLVSLQHSFSRGSVHISSSSPTSEPLIDLRMLDNDLDMEMMVDSMKLVRKITGSEPYRKAVVKEIVPGPEVDDDEKLKEFIRSTIQTVYHPIATASMLPREAGGVVDNKLKVYGTANLRVIDASILPIHVSATLQATVYGIAEMGADLIRRS